MIRQKSHEIKPDLRILIDFHDCPISKVDFPLHGSLPDHVGQGLRVGHPLVVGSVKDLGKTGVAEGVGKHPLGDVVDLGEVRLEEGDRG